MAIKILRLSLVLIIFVLLFIFLFDWSLLRPQINKYVSASLDRKFSIDGDIDVRFGFPPEISLEKVTLANPESGKEPNMLSLEKVQFTFQPLSIFRDHIDLPTVMLAKPVIYLEKNSDGKKNWQLGKSQNENDASSSGAPRIGLLKVDDGRLRYVDIKAGTDISLKLSTKNEGGDEKINFVAEGSFEKGKLNAEGKGGSVLALQDDSHPYNLDIKVNLGKMSLSFDGTILSLSKFKAINGNFSIKGDTMSDLVPLLPITLPRTGPYSISGYLRRDANEWSLDGFKGKVGNSDLNGDFQVNLDGKPAIEAILHSQLLDLEDLAGFIGGQPQTGEGKPQTPAQKKEERKIEVTGKILPNNVFSLSALNSMNADLVFKGKEIRGRKNPFDDFTMRFILKDGVLNIDPLNFGIADGDLVSKIKADIREKDMLVDGELVIKKVKLKKLFPDQDLMNESEGVIGGSAKIKGRGNSFASIVGNADGNIGMIVADGMLSNLLLEAAGLDFTELTRLIVTGDKVVKLNCAVLSFQLDDGLLKTRALVVDTDDTNLIGEGQISLKNETFDLTLNPQPKDVSILSLRSPLDISGTFIDPVFRPQLSALALRGGAAITLGVLATPIAALIPLIETGPGEDQNCHALLKRSRAKQ